jgi:hypothetical protein
VKPLNTEDAAKWLTAHGAPVAANTLRNWRAQGVGPATLPPITRTVWYAEAELRRWLTAKVQGNPHKG